MRVIIELVGGQSRLFRLDFPETPPAGKRVVKTSAEAREEVLLWIAKALGDFELFRIQDCNGRNAGAFKPEIIAGVVVEPEREVCPADDRIGWRRDGC